MSNQEKLNTIHTLTNVIEELRLSDKQEELSKVVAKLMEFVDSININSDN